MTKVSVGKAGPLAGLRGFYAFLSRANALIARGGELDRLYGEICDLAVELDRRLVLVWVGTVIPGSAQVRTAAGAGPATGYLEGIQVLRVAEDERGRGPTGRVLREGRCVVANRFLSDPTTRPWQAKAREFGIAASAAVPLRRDGQVCGALMFYGSEEDMFDAAIVEELEVLGQSLSFAIDAAEERAARRALEEQLLESRRNLRAIFDAADQTILMIRPEGAVLAVNRRGAERFDLTPQAMVGRNLFELMPPQVAARRRDAVAEALRGQAPVMLEDERAGRLFRATFYPLPEEPPSVVVYAEELTAQVAAERAARDAMRQFSQVVNLAREGIATLDLAGTIAYANPSLHLLLGAAEGGLIGRPAADFIAANSRADFFERLRRLQAGADSLPQGTYRLCRASGEEFPALVSVALKTSDANSRDGMVVVVTDISELQQAQEELTESKQRLEIALAGAAESIWQWNLDTGWAYWSPEFYRQLGYADQEFPGNADEWLGHMHPDDRQAVLNAIDRQLRVGQEILDITYRFRNQSGDWRWIRGRGKVVKIGDDGHPVLLTGTNVDVTEQHLEDERRRRQAERWLALLQLAQMGDYDDARVEREFLRRALEEARRLTGSQFGFLHFVSEDQSHCQLVAWTGVDLGADEAGNGSCAASEAGIWADSLRERRGLIVNDRGDEAKPAGSVEERAAWARLITVPVIEGDRVRAIAWVGNKAERYDQDDLEFLQLLATDVWRIVRRQRVEADLRETQQVVEASPAVYYRLRVGADLPVEYISRNVSQWGYRPEAFVQEGLSPLAMIHPDDRQRVAAELAEREAAKSDEFVQEYRIRRDGGEHVWVADRTRIVRDRDGVARYYEGVVTDIDADKRREQALAESLEVQQALNRKLEAAQTQLLQAEKMASIGQLAAGVAHELNNPIGFVNSNLGTLGGYLKDLLRLADIGADCPAGRPLATEIDFGFLRGDLEALLRESREGLERVRKIVQDLKDFSRVGETQWQWADLHAGLDSTLNIVWNELKYKCTISKHYGDLPQIYCVPSQLNQVFLNLLVNAAQAIEDRGEISIRTERIGDDEVRVAIADTGRGIAPEHINRVFEPFFTTKAVGKGTGLGLSLSWGIVQRHQGRIEVASEPGKGTTFTITLPVKPAATPAMIGEDAARTS